MQADGGRAHSVAVTSSGAIYTWGTGDRGQLGHRASGTHDDDDEVAWYPRRVTAGLPHLPVAFVSAGGDHSIAVFYGPVESTVSSADDDASDGRIAPRKRSGSSSSYHRSRAGTSTSDSGASLEDGVNEHRGAPSLKETDECQLLQPVGYPARPMELPPLLELAERVVKDSNGNNSALQPSLDGAENEESNGAVDQESAPKGDVRGDSQRREHGSSGASRSEEVALAAAIENIFFSVGFLSAGFTLPPEVIPSLGRASSDDASSRRDRDGGVSAAQSWPVHSGLDVESIEVVYQTFLRTYSTDVVAALANASGALLDQLVERFELLQTKRQRFVGGFMTGTATSGEATAAGHCEEERELKALLILLQSPLLGSDSVYRDSLCARAYECIMRLSRQDQRKLSSWLACYPSEVFVSRLVRPCQRYISEKSRSSCKHIHDTHALFDAIYSAVVSLAIFFEANEVRDT